MTYIPKLYATLCQWVDYAKGGREDECAKARKHYGMLEMKVYDGDISRMVRDDSFMQLNLARNALVDTNGGTYNLEKRAERAREILEEFRKNYREHTTQ